MVVGHSFGGKVALQYAAIADESLEQTWILDANPAAPADDLARISSRHVVRVLEALPRIPQPLDSREALVELLRSQGFTQDLAAWMTTNLRREADGYHWRFDLDGVLDMVADYARSDFFPDLEAGHFRGRIDIVRAARTRWPNYDLNRLQGLEARSDGRFGIHVLQAAGHWVHIDNAAGLLELLGPTFAS
jgi:pimeloyl-ACP methyl ester carboxylesterase